MSDILNYLRTITILLTIIVMLLFYKVVFIDTPSVGAGSRFTSVSIDAVGGNPIYDGQIPTK